MRKQIKISHEENMFGHTYHTMVNTNKITLAANLESDWRKLRGRLNADYFWFRAPKITLPQLTKTIQNLSDLSHKFEFKLWHDADTNTWDASLKLSDHMDAASWAWSHTEMWAKWSDAEEKEWKQSQKPRKLKVNKDGSVKVKVTVSTLADP